MKKVLAECSLKDSLQGVATQTAIKAGSWVRFVRENTVLVGVVHYVLSEANHRDVSLVTDHGVVSSTEVLEVRG